MSWVLQQQMRANNELGSLLVLVQLVVAVGEHAEQPDADTAKILQLLPRQVERVVDEHEAGRENEARLRVADDLVRHRRRLADEVHGRHVDGDGNERRDDDEHDLVRRELVLEDAVGAREVER